ncbi:DExH-box ATP-dependent RNA helicase DExH17 [Glycine soja]|uniref:DNA 3'-5' helicase n=1 Tax=Glycine soja TaxID=3848 RepID=A0A445GFG3_GLYSO|nr:DExH-box ATP-dependent RNA helicase DExH17 [Glycine soja]
MDSYSLKSVFDLPAPFRSCFSFRYFNSLQSECFPICFHSDVNMVISAPTGSGKTVLFELCILRLLSSFITAEERFLHLKGSLKTIYIAPSKALVQEKLRDWNKKFGPWGINCLELTGDNESYTPRNILEADIILTTPEKFDAVSRYGIESGGLSFFSDISLLLIDEVHLLNDPRGAALEAIVSRIKIVSGNPKMKSNPLAQVRFLAVSATIPNIEDLAKWLEVPDQGIKRFGEEMRPVKLTTKVFGYAPAKNDFLFEKLNLSLFLLYTTTMQRLQNYIFDILMQYSRGKSALVFCSTRKGAQEAAQRLSQIVMTFGQSNPFIKNREQQDRLREASLSCSDKQMQSYILYGVVGYHNGGLCLKDRSIVEGLFLKGDIQVLCTTNTLAHGINLPAHTVVIKSTQHFNKEKGLYMEYDRSTILQVHLYENLLNGCEVVESQLLSCVTEHLLAEIVQLTVSDITKAIEWLKRSYLYVRMKKASDPGYQLVLFISLPSHLMQFFMHNQNPMNYAIKKGISGDRLEKHVQDICVRKVNELSQNDMVWVDEDGFLLRPLDPGRLMTKYYLRFDTMKQIMRTPENCSLEDALHVVCCAEEIACADIFCELFLIHNVLTSKLDTILHWENEGIQLRRNEKKLLNEINADKDGRLRFHILGDKRKKKKRIQTREEKIFILANDCLTGDPSVHDLSLIQDMNSICSNGCRIAKCLKDYFVYKRNYKGTVNSALLAKSLGQKLWDDSPYLLKQLPGIGMVTAKALHSMGVRSFEELADADPRRIELVTGRKYPFGNHIKDSLLSLPPKVDVTLAEIESHIQGNSKLVVTLARISQSGQSVKRHYADMIVGSEEDNTILFHEKISPYSATIFVPIAQGKQTIKVDFIFEEYIGIDVHQKLSFTRESNSIVLLKRNKKQASCPPPEEIYVIEDDNITVPRLPTKELCKLNEDRDSIPSFDLLDESFEEVEGVRAFGVVEDECKSITEKTVFDHIREKAKNFSLLSAYDNIHFPSLEVLLSRNHAREKRPDHRHEVVVLDDEDRPEVPQRNDVNLQVELRKAEQDDIKFYLNDHCTTGSSNIVDTGVFLPEPEAITHEKSTEETVFDHIRRKSKDFPPINKLNCAESIIHKTELFSKINPSPPSSLSDAFGVARETNSLEVTDNMLTSYMKTAAEVEKYTSSIQEERKRSSDPGSFPESSKKQRCASRDSKEEKHSSSEIRRQCCSLESTSQMKEIESFLGFKSVFSFL